MFHTYILKIHFYVYECLSLNVFMDHLLAYCLGGHKWALASLELAFTDGYE